MPEEQIDGGGVDSSASIPRDADTLAVVSSKELIDHLSREIETYTKMIFDWRARAAFYWLVGPFVLIGSVVIVTKQIPTFQGLDTTGRIALGVVGLSFIGMAYLGARMETHMADQCNKWRDAIFRLTTEERAVIGRVDVVVKKQRVKLAYLIAHLLILLAFFSSMVIVSRSALSNPNPAESAASPPRS